MKDLKDYCGDFDPNLCLADFSKETLARAWETTARLYILLSGIWNSYATRKFGEQTALEAEWEIWRNMTWRDIAWSSEVFQIKGDDIPTAFKHLQVSPLIGVIYPTQFEMTGQDRGVFTIPKCISLEYLERTGKDDMIRLVCAKDGIDHWGFQQVASYYNPQIEVSPLKLPPRKGPDEIACQWEFRLT